MKTNVTVTHIVCISYLLIVVKYSLVCDSDTVWNVPLYGQAELIASIVFACHSLSVWGNTALNYLCCVTCSRNNITCISASCYIFYCWWCLVLR